MKTTFVPEQIVVPVLVETLIDGVTLVVTAIVIVLLVAVAGLGQAAVLIMLQVTLLLLASVVDVYVGLFVPTFDPLTCHWYVGVTPPLVGVAVNVTEVPAQMVLAAFETMFTDGVAFRFTVIVIALLVTFVAVAQLNELVMVQVITSPLIKPLGLYVALFVPTSKPFLNHW